MPTNDGFAPRIVYYGATGGGKTTCLQYICSALPEMKEGVNELSCGPMIEESLEPRFVEVGGETYVNTADSTQDFPSLEFMMLNLGSTMIHLYTLPLELPGKASRVILNADCIVFVVDSSPAKAAENLMAAEYINGIIQQAENCGLIVQLNKRDLPDAVASDVLDQEYNPWEAPAFESVATEGLGVFPALKAASQMALSLSP